MARVAALIQTDPSLLDLADNQVSPRCTTPAGMGHSAVVQILLARGANVDVRTLVTVTPLHLAAHRGQVQAARELLDRHAEVDAWNDKGWTPLNLAHVRHRAMVTLLLERGADLHARDDERFTPLHSAAEGGHAEVLNALLAKGADVNARVGHDRTALHIAAQGAHRAAAEVLLSIVSTPNRSRRSCSSPRPFMAVA